MKNVRIVFDDDEFQQLKQKKGTTSWHDFVLKHLDFVSVESYGIAQIKSTCPKCGKQLLVNVSDLQHSQ